MRAHEVKAIIREAFTTTPRPCCRLADALVADEYGNEAVRFAENDEHWWEVPIEHIEAVTASFCFLPPASVPYYLPAYMTFACDHYSAPRTGWLDNLRYFLADGERIGSVLPLLSPAQRHAVCVFLEFLATRCDRSLRRDGIDVGADPELNEYRQALTTIWLPSRPRTSSPCSAP